MPFNTASVFTTPAGLRLPRAYSAPGGLQTYSKHVHLAQVQVTASYTTKTRPRRAASLIPGAGRRFSIREARKSQAISESPIIQSSDAKKASRRHTILGMGFGPPVNKENSPPVRRRASHAAAHWLHRKDKEPKLGLGLALAFPAQLMVACHEHPETNTNVLSPPALNAIFAAHVTAGPGPQYNHAAESMKASPETPLTPPGAPLLPSEPFPPYARSRSIS